MALQANVGGFMDDKVIIESREKFGNGIDSKMLLPKTITIPANIVLTSAPKNIELYGKWYDLVIGIGNDHTARLLIDDDALRALAMVEPQVNIG